MKQSGVAVKSEVLDMDPDTVGAYVGMAGCKSERGGEEDDDEEEEEEEIVVAGGEGGAVVHGRAVMASNNRGDLFSGRLEDKIRAVVCLECGEVVQGLSVWRGHYWLHRGVPGYGTVLQQQQQAKEPAGGRQQIEFGPTDSKPFGCPRCNRCFSDKYSMTEHRHSAMRTVRLICPQCNGQFGDLEQHVMKAHKEDSACAICGDSWNLMSPEALLEHNHSSHEGFPSVLCESSTSCHGDGVTFEFFETVLETPFRFLATEVKPQSEAKKELDSGRRGRPTQASQVMTVKERYEYNVKQFRLFRSSGAILSKNDCEICGFTPYTKNKYREKQDHLAKFHFKERIDAILPTVRPYNCPEASCYYLGKDRQDILRHYTGKHNILKNWVDDFICEHMGPGQTECLVEQKPKAEGSGWEGQNLLSSDVMTFHEMEARAIMKERKHRVVNPSADGVLGSPVPPSSVLLRLPVRVTEPEPLHKLPQQSSSSGVGKLSSQLIELLKKSSGDVRPGLPSQPASVKKGTSSLLARGPSVVFKKIRCSMCPDLAVFQSLAEWKHHCQQEHPDPSADVSAGSEEQLQLQAAEDSQQQQEPAKKKARRPPPPLVSIRQVEEFALSQAAQCGED